MLTITEALAELKTIQKRVEKKTAFVQQYLTRQDGLKDPLLKEGGSPDRLAAEMQAIVDLEIRHLNIRMAIQRSNQTTNITIEGTTQTVAEWLTWRKELYPSVSRRLEGFRMKIISDRQTAGRQGGQVIMPGQADAKPQDLVVNMSEQRLADSQEKLATIVGTLDGQLSLKNATTTIDV